MTKISPIVAAMFMCAASLAHGAAPATCKGTLFLTLDTGNMRHEMCIRDSFWVDMAHYAGLIAAGYYPNPVPHADVVTSTTHKTLRGPRGGIILMKAEHEKALNSAIFPGLQGGPLMHVIAAKAVAFKEAAEPQFKRYQEQVIANARVMARVLGEERGLRIVSGRTESHVFLDVYKRQDLICHEHQEGERPPLEDGERLAVIIKGGTGK